VPTKTPGFGNGDIGFGDRDYEANRRNSVFATGTASNDPGMRKHAPPGDLLLQVHRDRAEVILSNHRAQKTEAASHAFTEWANRLTWKARLPFQVHAGGA
jgi:hypothetical protein